MNDNILRPAPWWKREGKGSWHYPAMAATENHYNNQWNPTYYPKVKAPVKGKGGKDEKGKGKGKKGKGKGKKGKGKGKGKKGKGKGKKGKGQIKTMTIESNNNGDKNEEEEGVAKEPATRTFAASHGAVDESKNAMVFQRYCHVYREGELPALFAPLVESKQVEIRETYWDTGNWAVVAKKLAHI